MTPGNPSERSNTGASPSRASTTAAPSTTSRPETTGSVKATASSVADTARDMTHQAAGQVKEKARGLFSDQKDRAVEGIGTVSSALRETASSLSDKNSPASSIIDRAADTLESFTKSIEGKDLDQILREVQSFARRKPAVFFGGAVAVGFLAARFFKSSAPDDFETGYATGFDRDPSGSPYQSSGPGSSSMGRDSGYGASPSVYGRSVSDSSSGGNAGSGIGGSKPNRGFGEDV